MADQPSRIIRQDGRIAESENPERRGFSREDFTGGATPSTSQRSVHPDSAQSLSGEIRPSDLRDYNGPLFVINKMNDMISHDDGKGNVMRIEPKYHRDHIAPLPIEVALHPGFQRLWRTGRVQVSKDPAVEDLLTLSNAPEDQGGILPYTLDAGQNKDLTPLECLICHDQVFLSQEDLDNGLPSLCEAHIDSGSMIERVPDANGTLVWKLKDTVVKRSL
jgi:hypothetical protein